MFGTIDYELKGWNEQNPFQPFLFCAKKSQSTDWLSSSCNFAYPKQNIKIINGTNSVNKDM